MSNINNYKDTKLYKEIKEYKKQFYELREKMHNSENDEKKYSLYQRELYKINKRLNSLDEEFRLEYGFSPE